MGAVSLSPKDFFVAMALNTFLPNIFDCHNCVWILHPNAEFFYNRRKDFNHYYGNSGETSRDDSTIRNLENLLFLARIATFQNPGIFITVFPLPKKKKNNAYVARVSLALQPPFITRDEVNYTQRLQIARAIFRFVEDKFDERPEAEEFFFFPVIFDS